MTDYRKFRKVQDGEVWGQESRLKLNNALSGKINVVQEVTLIANAGSTPLTDPLVGLASVVLLMPMSSNAAAALAGLYFSAPAAGSVAINHANNAQTDRTFRYAVLG